MNTSGMPTRHLRALLHRARVEGVRPAASWKGPPRIRDSSAGVPAAQCPARSKKASARDHAAVRTASPARRSPPASSRYARKGRGTCPDHPAARRSPSARRPTIEPSTTLSGTSEMASPKRWRILSSRTCSPRSSRTSTALRSICEQNPYGSSSTHDSPRSTVSTGLQAAACLVLIHSHTRSSTNCPSSPSESSTSSAFSLQQAKNVSRSDTERAASIVAASRILARSELSPATKAWPSRQPTYRPGESAASISRSIGS